MKINCMMVAYGGLGEPVLEINIPGDDLDPAFWRPHAHAIAKQLVKAGYRAFEIYEQTDSLDWVKLTSFNVTTSDPVFHGF